MTSFFQRPWFPRHPQWRSLPLLITRAAVLGAVTGPFIALFLGWLLGAPEGAITNHPAKWLMYSCAIGAIFSVSFYATCAVPMPWVGHWLRGQSKWVLWPALTAAAMLGGSAGCVVSILAVRTLLALNIVTPVSLSRLAVVDALIAAVIAIVIGLYTQKELQAKKQSEAAARAQAYALQAQINPHFFFNTLNTISTLIPSDAAAAQRMVGRLAEMFRYTLSCGKGELVPLERELEFVRNYLELEKERYRQRLEFRLPSAPEAGGVLLPGLTLQPLVENAVRHGIAKRLDGGQVNVSVSKSNGAAVVSVRNQTEGHAGIHEDPGHALANVRSRLRLAFGDHSTLSWSNQDGNWISVEIRVPSS